MMNNNSMMNSYSRSNASTSAATTGYDSYATMANLSSSNGASYTLPSTHLTLSVGLYDNRIQPPEMTVPLGATVEWRNEGAHVHTVTSANGLWDSGSLSKGETYQVTFSQRGTFQYYCQKHPDRMHGVVIVK
jgi:plastocyanin